MSSSAMARCVECGGSTIASACGSAQIRWTFSDAACACSRSLLRDRCLRRIGRGACERCRASSSGRVRWSEGRRAIAARGGAMSARAALAAASGVALAVGLLVRSRSARPRYAGARRQLRREPAGVRQFVDSTTAAAAFSRRDGRFTMVSAAFARMHEATVDELTGRSIADVVAPGARDRISEHLRSVYQRGIHTWDSEHVRKDGTVFPVAVDATVIRDASGRAVGVSIVVRSRGEHEAIEAALRRAHEIEKQLRHEVEQISQASQLASEAVLAQPHGSLRAVLSTIAVLAQAVTGATFVGLGIGTDPEVPFDPWVFVGVDDEMAHRLGRHPRPVGTLGVVIREGASLRLRDLREHPDFRGFPAGHPIMTSFLGVPISSRARAIGHIYLTNKRDAVEFSEQDQRTVELIAARAGTVVEIASFYESEVLERVWLQAVIDQMPEGVMVLDAAGHVSAQNRAMSHISIGSGSEVDPLGNRVSLDLVWPSGEHVLPKDLPHVRAFVQHEGVLGADVRARTPEGRLISLCVSAAPVHGAGGEVIGATAVFQDITTIQEAARMRQEWSSVVAHDLRQPVTVIKIAAGLVAKAHASGMNESEAKAVERIVAAASRLEVMIGELLDVSCLEAQRLVLNRRPVDVVALAEEVALRLSSDVSERVISVRASEAIPRLFIDPGRIEQVLGNLLTNAMKYGAPATPIIIDLERRATDVLVTVSNEGRGIPPDEMDSLFHRFARSRMSRSSGTPGIGLGLYICKGFVEAHGGRIWIECTPDQVTRVRFTLPVVAMEAREDETQPA
ncbi:Osmosensitive K+ channel histidine kinase KdpD [Minicystis rosea]|nr:Osmosensitive K+ channel histidine kinase KdpD [Minicystis rosea]